MNYPGYNTANFVFLDGEWYPFKIFKLVQLQDDKYYYILQDINGLKHFLPSEFYENYGFKIGEEVLCRIDRINCTGRLFLEPKHPDYEQGESYSFEIISYSEKVNEKTLLVREKYGKTIELNVNNMLKADIITEKFVRCKVLNLKKGIPLLEVVFNSL